MKTLIDRTKEVDQFYEDIQYFDHHAKAPIYMVQGGPGMGKSYLMEHFKRIAELRNMIVVWVDCHLSQLSIEVLLDLVYGGFYDSHQKCFADYIRTRDQASQIDKTMEANMTTASAQMGVDALSEGAKAASSLTPAAPFADAIKKGTSAVVSGSARGLYAARQWIAQNKLSKELKALYKADPQRCLCHALADGINQVANGKHVVLFIDRFEKLQAKHNDKSDIPYQSYWRDDFLARLSERVFVIQGGQQPLPKLASLHRAKPLHLEPFEPGHLTEYFRLKSLADAEERAQRLFAASHGYPVSVGTLVHKFKSAEFWEQIRQDTSQITADLNAAFRDSITWLLGQEARPERELIYIMAAACRNGRLNIDAVRYYYREQSLSLSQLEDKLHKLTLQYAFIDLTNFTFHEVPRRYILIHVQQTQPGFLSRISRELARFCRTRQGESQ